MEPIATPLTDSLLLDECLDRLALPEVDQARIRRFAADGYLVIDLDLPDFDVLAGRIIADLAPRYPRVAGERRIEEAWYWHEDVRRLAACPQILATLAALYRRRPFPFQTLNFDRGSEQAAHSDTLHFSCIPHGFMCGVWVALEDIDAACGPLFVYPGSHRLPEFDMHRLGLPASRHAYGEYEAVVGRILGAAGFARQEMLVRKGQAVIWAANLFHGGSPVLDRARTRHSQATHYYFEDCLYYMTLESDPAVGRMCLRETIDIGADRFVPPVYRGVPVDLADYAEVWRYPRPLPARIVAETSAPSAARGAESPADRIVRLEHRNREQRAEIDRLRTEIAAIRATPTFRIGAVLKDGWRRLRGRQP